MEAITVGPEPEVPLVVMHYTTDLKGRSPGTGHAPNDGGPIVKEQPFVGGADPDSPSRIIAEAGHGCIAKNCCSSKRCGTSSLEHEKA
jgi:hypothetical protein